MTDATTTTTAQAPNNPTAPGPMTQRQAEPTRHDNQTPTNPYATPADRWSARTAPGMPAAPRPGVIEDRAFEALSPEQQNGYARVKKPGPDGGSEWVQRDQLGKEPAADGQQPGTAATPDKVKVGDYELSANDVAMLMQQKAAADLKATQVPAEASGYEPKLPEGLKLPPGVDFKVDPSEPGFEDLRQFAKRIGLTQSEFSDALGIYAASQAAKEADFQSKVAAEFAKMGPNVTQRITAIETWIRGMIGDEFGTPLRAMIVSERQAVAFEKLMHKFVSQGAASFRQDGREPQAPQGRVSEDEYAAMSSAERWNYSRQFDQRQFTR